MERSWTFTLFLYSPAVMWNHIMWKRRYLHSKCNRYLLRMSRRIWRDILRIRYWWAHDLWMKFKLHKYVKGFASFLADSGKIQKQSINLTQWICYFLDNMQRRWTFTLSVYSPAVMWNHIMWKRRYLLCKCDRNLLRMLRWIRRDILRNRY